MKMNRILLTNIGNRNIVYRGKNYAELFRTGALKKETTFRNWTLDILNNYEEEKIHLKLKILPPLLDKLHGKFDALILFYSDQETHNHQDTIFMAEIIRKMLLDENVGYRVIPQKIQGSVVDNNSLLKFYRQQINYLNFKFKKPFYFICDAGGTPQCKSTLKISAEFVLHQDQFKVFYVNPNSTIDDVDTDEYRSIINMEQAIVLIGNSEYLAALNILNMPLEEAISSRSLIGKILAHLYLRKNKFYDSALLSLKNFKMKNLDKIEILKSTYDKIPLGGNQDLIEFFGEEAHFNLVEQLYGIILQRDQRNYTDLIMRISMFYEYVLYMIIENKYGYKLNSDYYNASKDFVEDCNKGRFDINWMETSLVGEKEVRGVTIPVMMEVIRIEKNELVKSLFNHLIPFFPKERNRRINTLRNNIAHRGLYVDYNTFKKRTPVGFFDTLNKLIKFFDLKYANIYNDLNEIAIKILRST